MTTYLTTKQCTELAELSRVSDCDFGSFESRLHTFANAAIQSYIDSLVEGLPEPEGDYATDLYTRDQLLQCIAKAKGER